MSKQLQIIAFAAAALVLSGGGFVAGMTVGPSFVTSEAAASASPAASGAAARRPGAQGPGGGGAFGGGLGQQVVGRVLSVGEGSITVEIRQPGAEPARSVIALVGSSARVVRSSETDIKLADIKAGDQVVVLGQTDATTGTVSANAVVVGQTALQQLFGGGGQGTPRPSGSGAPRPAVSPSPRP